MKSLSFTDTIDLYVSLKSFYFSVTGLLLVQYIAYVLAYHAGNHSKFPVVTLTDLASEAFVRGFFILIHGVFMLIFESRLHLFQLRLICCLWLNACLVMARTEANPVLTFFLLVFIS